METASVVLRRASALVRLIREAFPISASRVGLSLVVPVGIAALGSAGSQQQGAFGLAATFNNWFLVVGPAILLSGFFKGAESARRGEPIQRELLLSVLTLCALVGAASLGMAALLAGILRHTYADAVGILASRVLMIQALGNIFYFYLAGVMLLLEGIGRSRVIVVIIFCGLMVNVGLNELLLRHAGRWAEPAELAAWGTFAARVLGGMAVAWYLAKHVFALHPAQFVFGGTRRTVASLLRVGIASGAGKAAEAAAFAGLGAFAAAIDSASMAAYAIFYGFVSIVYMSLIGFTNATARSLAEHRPGAPPRFDRLAPCVALFAVVAVILVGLSSLNGAALWIWFNPSAHARPLLCEVSAPAALAAIGFAAVFLMSQLSRSLGLHRSASACLVTTYPVLMLAMAWYAVFRAHMGLVGLVWSFVFANIFGLTIFLTLYRWACRLAMQAKGPADVH